MSYNHCLILTGSGPRPMWSGLNFLSLSLDFDWWLVRSGFLRPRACNLQLLPAAAVWFFINDYGAKTMHGPWYL